ncbi:MAG TPA: TerB family tellurite resistance protein [Paracoccaceae bacterium]|nr:TerB family tellurite resistance protein [Paracoccaceae bacterium]
MIGRLLAVLTAASPPPGLEPEDARLALAALLVRAARADGAYDAAERAMVDRILRERFALDPWSAGRLRAEAEEIEAGAPDTVRFTRAVKAAVPYEERFEVVTALWRVVLADGARDAGENGFLRLVVSLLGVSDRDSGLARQGAERSP